MRLILLAFLSRLTHAMNTASRFGSVPLAVLPRKWWRCSIREYVEMMMLNRTKHKGKTCQPNELSLIDIPKIKGLPRPILRHTSDDCIDRRSKHTCIYLGWKLLSCWKGAEQHSSSVEVQPAILKKSTLPFLCETMRHHQNDQIGRWRREALRDHILREGRVED